MSPQSEGRPSIDGRPGGGVSHMIGGANQLEGYNPNTPSNLPRSNGYDAQDGQMSKSKFAGSAPGNGNDSTHTTLPDGRVGREKEYTGDVPIRDRSRTNGNAGGKTSSGTLRLCKKCNEPLTGQFVRALGGTFHLDCFKCRDCGQIVASKFFPVDDEDGNGQYPLCETDYFRRLDLLCFECGGALRGSYITALERKYHIEHFTCSVCPTVFGAQDSYYEHEGKVYCHYHYSTQFAQRCNGCQTAILKQFVEIFRNGQNQHWHPECYMIHKFWNVRLAPSGTDGRARERLDTEATDAERTMVREEEEKMEEKVYRIWSVLSTFEESSAACISDMLLHVSNGAYIDGVLVAKKFIWHVDILFTATDRLHHLIMSEGMKELSYGREAKLLCKKIVAFFSLLSKTQETGVRKLGVTQELLSLVTGLAHYLKLLIRISLQGALKLERERSNTEGLHQFLGELSDLESIKDAEKSLVSTVGVSGLADQRSDLCFTCKRPIDDECIRMGERRWHWGCIACVNCERELRQDFEDVRWSERDQVILCRGCVEERGQSLEVEAGFEPVTRLRQYVYLLRVALARLLSVLRSGGTLPHTSDDPNLSTYDSNEGHRVLPTGQLEPPLLRLSTRSKSYGGTSAEEQNGSSYEQTLGDIKRLRSTRMDKHLSTTIRKARTSRIIDGPEGRSIRPGSAGADGSDQRNNGFQIVEDRDANGEAISDLTFGNQDALTLDDIPRIVAAEQAKEQRPNAYKHARNPLFGSGSREPKLLNGHQRAMSGGHELDRFVAGEPSPQRAKKYFSELSALEYFIVRHVAVVSMGPLLEGHFNLEELLGLIESRKPTFWGKFGKAFKNDRARGGKKKGVFGVPLDTLVERAGVESTYGVGPGALRIPGLIDDAISAMRQMDMSVEGVFRKNGNIRRLRELADQIDAKDGDGVDLTRENPVQVAALLKKFLRALPDPLLTFKLHRLFITSQKFADEDKRRRVLHLTCCLLPKSHRDSLEVLFSFLNWVASFSHVDEESGSKMDAHNLATVITPNILSSNSKTLGMDDSFLAIEAVHSLIECNDAMCEVPEDLQSILNDSSLFNNSSDITTKEILKRYGDIGRAPGPQRTVEKGDSPPSRSKEGNNSRGGAPRATRIDIDAHQASAWQKESSVRHVQESGGPTYATNSNQTPPQNQFEFSTSNSPYRQRAGSSDGSQEGSHGATPNRQSYRHSGWGKQQGQPGPMGVTGAG
ncbi:MAG: hypothetical protein M1830_001901 [Pleopsidium flavum]|nr:MAG: hypothetical protein M1830_001901 [Pleopsidium flavum]